MPNIAKPAQVNNIWSVTGTKTDPGAAKSNTGWVVELPQYQTANYIEWKQDTYIAHTNQHGIAVWDAVTEYQGGQSYTKGSNGLIYKALLTNTNVDPVNPLNTASWAQAFEVYGSVAVVQNQLTEHLTNYATLSGITNVAAARVNLSIWSRAESDARYAPIAGNAAQTFAVAVATDPTHAVRLGQVSALLTQATEANLGVVRIASNADVAQGTDDTKAITPLKAATVYLSKAGNLAGLASVSTARTNLGLGTIATEAAGSFLRASNNLSELASTSVARANLGLTSTATQPETYFVRVANNLNDVDPVASRANLGLTSTAITPLTSLMLKSDNLAGLANVATARTNLGLTTLATTNPTTVMYRVNNLSDVSNVQSARNNLGLGSAATRNVVGVPADLNFTASIDSSASWYQLPNGIIEQFGRFNMNSGPSVQTVGFGRAFPNAVLNIQLTRFELAGNEAASATVKSFTTNNFTFENSLGNTATEWFWRATGY